MRHGASLIASMEGMSRLAFRIAKELAQNSRSGLTIRFLSKKLEFPQEEIEYVVDVNSRAFFTDITRVKLVPEGLSAVKRISAGLENRGDVPSLFALVKALNSHDFRRLEERIGIEKPGGKKAAAEQLVNAHYRHPDSIVEYVATRGFSAPAQEVFDLLWHSKDGIMPVSRLRTAFSGSDYEAEQALWELFQGFAAFEMFRFDSEDRLRRVAGLLSEVRQTREKKSRKKKSGASLKALRNKPIYEECRGLDFSDRVCRIVAAVAAKPVRVRGDGDLFREDRRRLDGICEDDNPSLATCLWVAEGAGWLVRVDNELRAGNLDKLLELDRLRRHRILYEWLVSQGGEAASRRAFSTVKDDLKKMAWYPVMDFIEHARLKSAHAEQPVLRSAGGHWRYMSPSAVSGSERGLARSLEESLLWLGVVDRAEGDDGSLFRLTELGDWLLTPLDGARKEAIVSCDVPDALAAMYPEREGQFVVQPNFDIVVPTQDVDPLLTVPLEQFAECQSSGSASVYHMSKESFTKSVQEGHDGDALVSFLMKHNRGGSLPGNVVTTLDDWRGGMKHVRLRTLHVVEVDDPLVLADLVHRRRLSKYFANLDPQKVVAYSSISRAALAKELEKEGFVIN